MFGIFSQKENIENNSDVSSSEVSTGTDLRVKVKEMKLSEDFIIDSLGRTRPKTYAVAPRVREHLKNGTRFVFTIEGRSKLIEERVTSFINSRDCALGVYAREGGRNMIHPHYQGYIELRIGEDDCAWQSAPRGQTVMNRILGEVGAPYHVERAKGTRSACINYVYAINCYKDYEIGDVVARSGTFQEPAHWIANSSK